MELNSDRDLADDSEADLPEGLGQEKLNSFFSTDKDEMLLHRLQWANSQVDKYMDSDTNGLEQAANLKRQEVVMQILQKLEKEILLNKSASPDDIESELNPLHATSN